MTTRFIKGAVTISTLAASSTLGVYAVAIGWTALKAVATGEVVAALVEQNENLVESNKQIATALEAYQEKSDEKIDKIVSTVTEVSKDAATSKELLKLMAPRFQIESEAVEKRIIKEVVSDVESNTNVPTQTEE